MKHTAGWKRRLPGWVRVALKITAVLSVEKPREDEEASIRRVRVALKITAVLSTEKPREDEEDSTGKWC